MVSSVCAQTVTYREHLFTVYTNTMFRLFGCFFHRFSVFCFCIANVTAEDNNYFLLHSYYKFNSITNTNRHNNFVCSVRVICAPNSISNFCTLFIFVFFHLRQFFFEQFSDRQINGVRSVKCA